MGRPDHEEVAQLCVSRLTDLEMLFTHLQRTVHELDQVVIRQERRLDALEEAIRRLSRDVDGLSLSGTDEEKRSAEDERPPHY